MNRLLLTTLTAFFATTLFAQVGFRFESVQPLPKIINGIYEENSPVYDPVQERLYFSRTLHPDNKGGKTVGQDLWYSDRQGNAWSQPSNDLNKLNNYLNNAPIGLSEDGERMYMIGTYIKKVSLQSGFSVTQKEDGDWPRPVAMDIANLNIRGSFYGGYMAPTEDVMIISMESGNSKGEEDLYVSFKTPEGWSKPKWMGDSINTSGYEISPYLFYDKKTLMFASNGLGGEGDCDIFYSYRLDSSWTRWSKPVNAGKKINSSGFDAFPFAYGETLYFSSNRDDSLSNIYTAKNTLFHKEAGIVRIVFEAFDSRLPDAQIQVRDEEGELVGKHFANRNGIVEIDGLREKKEYTFKPEHSIVDYTKYKPMLLNSDGAYVEELSFSDDGSILFTPRLEEDLAAMPAIQQEPMKPGMQGIFEVDRTPISGIVLALVDENGEVQQYTSTQSGGKFKFAETPDDQKLKIQIVTELEYIKKNGTIYYTDDLGNRLFKSVVDENGQFAYQKLEAKEMARLKMLANDNSAMKASTSASKGVFSYENLPQEGVTLQLYDDAGNLVEEVVTNQSGEFQFTKLRADQNFSIRPADGGLAAGDLAFLDDNGNRMSLEGSGDDFRFEALRPEIIQGLQLLQEDYDDDRLDQNFVFTIGLYKYKSLPKDGIRLNLLDENDNIVETVTTDASGHFVFSMLKPDKKYRVQVVGVSDEEMDETQLYFVDNLGNVSTAMIDPDKYYSFEQLSKDYFFNISQINTDEASMIVDESFKDVIGKFNYQNLPKGGVELQLLDEFGKVIETVLTDENGDFIFSRLAKESEYMVRWAENDAGLLDEAQFVFENEENEELVQAGQTKDGFKFVTLARDDGSIAGIRLTENPQMDISKFIPKELNSAAPKKEGEKPKEETFTSDIERGDLKLQTLYFNFNSVRLSNNDRYRLNHNVVPKIRQSAQPILIVGYSCDVGDTRAAAQVSKLRAEMVKKYLVNLGMEPEMIIIEGIGAPDEPLTYGQRLERRRVDIFHLAP